MPAAASDPAISVAGLVKHYGPTKAVDGLSFEVARGEVFGLLGPNGAGKTTTVETLEGYRDPDRGTVRVLGLDPVRDAPALRPCIGVMLQEGGLYPGLKPLELLRLFAAYYDDAESPEALLDTVGLRDAANIAVRRLSGGQKQRLSLAAALVGRPEVVFLDEPTAGMDPHARATTWQLVRDLRDRGVTVLLTTHAMDEAEQLCDRVAIVTGGKLAALGSPAELTRHAVSDEIWFAAAPGLDVLAIGRALGLGGEGVVEDRVVEDRPGEYVIRAPGTPGRIADLACFLRDENVTLAALQAGRRSLEEVFLQITAEEAR
ncbi:MAG: type transport system ATP-binding protein [Actinomycetota bacterium]|jgi:ABC-2 type transport system ATP-binding protein|nr:type transport system ATP-binding protein [Actinomycetota bacterium]